MEFDNNVSLVSDTIFKHLMKNESSKKWLLEIIKRKTRINLRQRRNDERKNKK